MSSTLSLEDGDRSSFRNVFFRILDNEQGPKKKLIPSVIHHHQNPLESTSSLAATHHLFILISPGTDKTTLTAQSSIFCHLPPLTPLHQNQYFLSFKYDDDLITTPV
jgi:hypothetical protein